LLIQLYLFVSIVINSYFLALLISHFAFYKQFNSEWWGVGMVICQEQGADLHMAQLMPMPLTVSCFNKIQIGFTFLVPDHPGSPGQGVIKWVWVCVCVCVRACVFNSVSYVHRESKKTRHLTLAHNFTKYWPIFKILSLLDLVGNL